MTFLRSLEQYGFGVSWRQAGLDFANSRYALWVANDAGRRNLRNGIAPPDSSHPRFHNCAGAIDYQIEADYAGLICPGMPNAAIAVGEKFGRLMNYGDGFEFGSKRVAVFRFSDQNQLQDYESTHTPTHSQCFTGTRPAANGVAGGSAWLCGHAG